MYRLQVLPLGLSLWLSAVSFGKMYLCDLCIHRIGRERQKGKQTACEAACPARAIHVGTTDEISALMGAKAAKRAGKEK